MRERDGISEKRTTRRESLRHLAGMGLACARLPIIATASATALLHTGCLSGQAGAEPDLIIGSIGIGPGKFQKPRAIAIDATDRLFVVDMTGRIQTFTADGEPLKQWRTPEIYQGKPTGLTIAPNGNLWVADTHYHRVLEYTVDGELLEDRTLGGTQGIGPGEFGLVTDIVIDGEQRRYVSEYGENDRVQVFEPDGSVSLVFGRPGVEPGEFRRPQSLAVDEQGHLWVADACNHRIQVFDCSEGEARIVDVWGTEGRGAGEFRYPYGLVLAPQGTLVITEYGNHRVQLLKRTGEPIASWGAAGREPGQLDQPWSTALDSRGRCFVLDSYNHRIQRFRFPALPSMES
ncbi:MAG: hypothetical protein KDA83_01410 [Planctomycetales bacterium]|nr:hypothetical protein [Planctomycetales bacterium]